MRNPAINRCPEMLEYCSSLVRAAKQGNAEAAQEALYEIFHDRFSDDHVSMLIASGEVTVPPADQALPAVLPCTFEADYDGGCYLIPIAGRTTTVSRNLKKLVEFGRRRVDAFVELVKRVELPKLAMAFADIERVIQQTQSAATVAFPVLDEILNRNSQWSFKVFAANLGTTPFLVAPKTRLFVQGTNNAEYTEACELVLLETSREGEEIRRRTTAPLILRAQSDLIFIVVTTTVQAEMELGGELRAVFKSGKARCQISFEAEQVGFWRRTIFSSPDVPFRSTD